LEREQQEGQEPHAYRVAGRLTRHSGIATLAGSGAAFWEVPAGLIQTSRRPM
jgi:hypothetical protein